MSCDNVHFCELDASKMDPLVRVPYVIEPINYVLLLFVMCLVLVNGIGTVAHLLSWGDQTKKSLIHSFSLIRNTREIFKSSSTENKLACVDGLRAITLLWIVTTHHFIVTNIVFDIDEGYVKTWSRNPVNILIASGVISNDTFFVISGLLAGLALLDQIKNPNPQDSLLKTYLRRYLRIAPGLIVAVLIYATVPLPSFSRNPALEEKFRIFRLSCREHWLSTITLTQNYLNNDSLCIPQSWHLTAEWHLFLIAPFFMKLLHSTRNKLAVITVIALIPSILGFYVAFEYNLFEESIQYKTIIESSFFYTFYIKTHIRAAPYIIGLGLSYYIDKYKDVKSESLKRHVRLLWGLSISLLLFVLFVHQIYHFLDFQANSLWISIFAAFHLGFSRVIWSIGIALWIFLCVQGYGGLVNKFLSHHIFTILRKFNLSNFLTHIGIQFAIAGFRRLKYMHVLIELHSIVGDFGSMIVVSFICAVAIELPFIAIGNSLFRKPIPNKRLKLN